MPKDDCSASCSGPTQPQAFLSGAVLGKSVLLVCTARTSAGPDKVAGAGSEPIIVRTYHGLDSSHKKSYQLT